jgi:HEAT repeat protein/protein involved in polysaccharide export with SLBB domain
MLLAFSRHSGRLALVGSSYPLRFGKRRTVKTRIHHLLEENMDRWITPLSVRRSLVLGAAVLALAVGLGSFRLQALETDDPPAAPDPESPPAAPAPKASTIGSKEQASRVKLPTRVAPYQVLRIDGTGLLPRQPITGLYLVEPEGTVSLCWKYGRIKLEGLTFQEASEAIEKSLQQLVLAPTISVELVGWVPKWQCDESRKAPYKIEPPDLLRIEALEVLPRSPITGIHLVQPDGTVNLGPPYGSVKVGGLALAEAAAAIETQLKKRVVNPKVLLTLAGWENDWFDLRKGGSPSADEGGPAPERKPAQAPYRVKQFDVLKIISPTVDAAFPLAPLGRDYLVEPDGTINLGKFFGRTDKVAGSTLKEATGIIQKQLSKRMRGPEILVSLVGRLLFGNKAAVFQEPFRIQPMQPLHITAFNVLPKVPIPANPYVVDQYGIIDFGHPYGKVKVGGLTFEEAVKAIEKQLKETVSKPEVRVTWYGIQSGEWRHMWRNVRESEEPDPSAAKTKKAGLRYGGKTFEQWRTELTTELKPEVRIEGIKALSTFGANGYGAEAAAAIVEVMQGYDPTQGDEDDQRVINAGLDAFAKLDRAAVPVLLEALRKDHRNVRRFAVRALGRLSTDTKTIVPALLKAMQDEDHYLRRHALLAVLAIDPQAPGFLEALIQALKDKDVGVRLDAVNSLQQFGPRAGAAVPMLAEALQDENAQIRSLAALALNRIGTGAEAAAPALAKALKDPDTQVRRNAIYALQTIQPKAKVVVAALIEATKDQDNDVRVTAVDLVSRLGAEAKDAVPALIQLLKDPRDQVWVIDLLGRIGPGAKEAVPALTELLRKSPGLRRQVAEALNMIEPESRK